MSRRSRQTCGGNLAGHGPRTQTDYLTKRAGHCIASDIARFQWHARCSVCTIMTTFESIALQRLEHVTGAAMTEICGEPVATNKIRNRTQVTSQDSKVEDVIGFYEWQGINTKVCSVGNRAAVIGFAPTGNEATFAR